MIRLGHRFGTLLTVFVCLATVITAQDPAARKIVADLNAVLAKAAMAEDVLALGDDGVLTRTLRDGRVVRFALKDIDVIDTDYDGAIGNLLLHCAANRPCIENRAYSSSEWTKGPLTALSFAPGADLDAVTVLLRNLKAAIPHR